MASDTLTGQFLQHKVHLSSLEEFVRSIDHLSFNNKNPGYNHGLKENIQFFSYRLAKPSKPIFFPKVAKSEAN